MPAGLYRLQVIVKADKMLDQRKGSTILVE
jgi:hypothetical protein